MLEKLKQLFGFGPKIDFQELIRDGAQIVDVRTEAEYRSGHFKGSVNIPLQTLEANLSSLKKDKTVITCCASGMRSARGKGILRANGFKEVHNGGAWTSL